MQQQNLCVLESQITKNELRLHILKLYLKPCSHWNQFHNGYTSWSSYYNLLKSKPINWNMQENVTLSGLRMFWTCSP